MSYQNTQKNDYIHCNTRGFIRGTIQGAGFEKNSIYTEPMHNGLVDIDSKEWSCSRITLGDKEYIVFANDNVGMTLEDLKNMQIMANYKGAREGITGLYGVGLVALRSEICGETGRIYHMSLLEDLDNKYSNVNDFTTLMCQGNTNKDELQAIWYNMADLMKDDLPTRLSFSQELPINAKQIWEKCAIHPLKKGTVMAYECCEEHIKFLDAQEQNTRMDHSNMKYNALFSANDVLNENKKMKFLGKYLEPIPSLEDYLNSVGNIQTWAHRFDVKHKNSVEYVDVTFERKENIVIHTVYEFKQEELKYLGFEITENVLPYVIQKKGESPYMLKETMKGSREFGRGLKPVSSSLTKPTFNKKLNEIKQKASYIEEHKAIAVADYKGYKEFITPSLTHNGFIPPPTKEDARRIIYGNKKKRDGVYLQQEWDELTGKWDCSATVGFKKVQNIISWKASRRGDELHKVMQSKFKLGDEDKKLKRVHDFIQHKENMKTFGGMVKKKGNLLKYTLKHTIDIETDYELKIGQNFRIMLNGQEKQVELTSIEATSELNANVIVTEDNVEISLVYNNKKPEKNTFYQAILAYENRNNAPPPPPTVPLQPIEEPVVEQNVEEEEEEYENEDEDEDEDEDVSGDNNVTPNQEENTIINEPPNPTHIRGPVEVNNPITRDEILKKLETINTRNNNNEFEDNVVDDLSTRLSAIYNTILTELYGRRSVLKNLLISAVARSQSTLQNRISDITEVYEAEYQANRVVIGGSEINTIYDEVTVTY